MRKYEAMFIIKPDVEEARREKMVDAISKSITKNGGVISVSEKLGKRRLAYTINKYSEGDYQRIEFEIDPGSIPTLKKDYKLNEDIIREMIIVKE